MFMHNRNKRKQKKEKQLLLQYATDAELREYAEKAENKLKEERLMAVGCICVTVVMVMFMSYVYIIQRLSVLEKQIGSAHNVFADDTNVRDFTELSIQERVRVNELKVNSYLNWANDPRFAWSEQSECKNKSKLIEYDERKKSGLVGLYDHYICLDDFPPVEGDCLIYDFGIRQQPEFGKILADLDLFNCEVHAFDPSPVAVDWWEKLSNNPDATHHALTKNPNYHFHPYGIGGVDGKIKLFEYNWGQVSNLAFSDLFECDKERCNVSVTSKDRKEFYLDVKTLPTIMAELGHQNRKIDIIVEWS